MIYNSWTIQLNILMRLSSVLYECWCCKATCLGFLCIFDVKLCPWRLFIVVYLFRSTDDVSLSLIPLVHVVDQEETGYGVGHRL